ncbi:hypothetical protein SAMN05421749_102304 [Acinetobacter marinus]|uniref:Uncharacterized protein n=2 Tax=Acinetobacter marinus TaxID=281375 RepID=A0A1G6HIT3_9GAMM|nr:hypothetical protein SAMN05421749_102304 [Acinetobacter marinus]
MKIKILNCFIASIISLSSVAAHSETQDLGAKINKEMAEPKATMAEAISYESELPTYIETTNIDIDDYIWRVEYTFNPATKHLVYAIKNPHPTLKAYNQRVEEIAKSYNAQRLSYLIADNYVNKQGYTKESPPDKKFTIRLSVQFLQGAHRMPNFERNLQRSYGMMINRLPKHIRESCKNGYSGGKFDLYTNGYGRINNFKFLNGTLTAEQQDFYSKLFLGRKIVRPYNLNGVIQSELKVTQEVKLQDQDCT